MNVYSEYAIFIHLTQDIEKREMKKKRSLYLFYLFNNSLSILIDSTFRILYMTLLYLSLFAHEECIKRYFIIASFFQTYIHSGI